MKYNLSFLITLFSVLFCFSQKYHFPEIKKQSQNNLDIQKIIVDQNNTTIYFNYYASQDFVNGGWVNINPNIYIQNKLTNEKFILEKNLGIPTAPKKYNFSKKGEKLSFTLIFPSIGNLKEFDLIECDNSEGCFNIYGIVLMESSTNSKTVYYDKDYYVTSKDKAEFYAKFNYNAEGEIIDYINFYNNLNDSQLMKYQASRVSNTHLGNDILIGEHFYYDESGAIRRKVIHPNPKEITYLNYLEFKNDVVFDFDITGKLVKYKEFNMGSESIAIEYDTNQDIVFANDLNEKFYYQGNLSSGYELTYNERFTKENTVFNMNVRDYSNGSTKLENDGYIIESKNSGGMSEVFDIDFDMNDSDWVITTKIKRLNSIQGAGLTLGTNNEGTSFQSFMISGDNHFAYYNIFNGFNISELKDWQYSNIIEAGNAVNTLSILKMNNDLFFSVNGKGVYKTNYSKVISNSIGLFVDKKNNIINFDYLVIKKLNTTIPSKFYSPKNYITNRSGFKGNGTGFLLNKSGYIATNYHVVESASEIYVEINNKDYKCKVIDLDKINDLAILKIINQPNLTSHSIFTRNSSETGSDIFVLGFPYALSLLGNEIKLTDGKISSQSGFQGENKTFQISAPIQPGNSGGPLFNKDGNIIGIVSSKFTGGENVGYAIKIDYLKNLLIKNNIIANAKNDIKALNFIDKVKILSNTTYLIKTK
jgi:hypothetical protein